MVGKDLAPAYAHCADLVRRTDPDRYFSSLFWPQAARPHAHAILAFAAELAAVPDLVSDPMLGEIRLQWWRDAIAGDEPAGHPVAEALLATLTRFNLDRPGFLAATEARAFDLYGDPMPSEAALEAYVRDVHVTTVSSIARVLAPGRLPPACVAAAGEAFGRVALLRGLPRQLSRGQLFIPLDLLASFALPAEDVLARIASPALGLVLTRLRARARVPLAAMSEGLPGAGAAGLACLPAMLCEPFLKVMERARHVAPMTPVELSPLRRQWLLWRGARALHRVV